MLGTKNMTLGLSLCVLSIVTVVGVQYAGLPDWISKIAYATTVVGGVIFVAGLFHSFAHGATKRKGVHQDDQAVSAMTLIRSMIGMSIADNHLDDREVATILKIYTQLTGSQMDEETVRDAAADMMSQGVTIADELQHAKDVIGEDLKLKIVKAALFILAADGTIHQEEEDMLEDIRKSLGVPKFKFSALKKKFLDSRDLSVVSAEDEES